MQRELVIRGELDATDLDKVNADPVCETIAEPDNAADATDTASQVVSESLAIIAESDHVEEPEREELEDCTVAIAERVASVQKTWEMRPADMAREKYAEYIGQVRNFEAGHFDGMQDCYEYRRTPFTEAFGDVQYIFIN